MNNNNGLAPLKNLIVDLFSPQNYRRFDVFLGEKSVENKVLKSKTVGMAYLREGDARYSIKLFTFVEDRFYLLADPHDSSLYRILTSIPNHSEGSKRKYLWNVIGTGKVNTKEGLIELSFDLFEKPIYMNLFPERSATGTKIPEPSFIDGAA